MRHISCKLQRKGETVQLPTNPTPPRMTPAVHDDHQVS